MSTREEATTEVVDVFEAGFSSLRDGMISLTSMSGVRRGTN